MKKMNSKGFTLIELLAVITIMGILMMVAIPNVSRTIENARRDTFADIAHEYLNAVRNAVLADQIECDITVPGETDPVTTVASGIPDGWYYFNVDTTDDNTKDLMESGGKSPFGNTELKGVILWEKKSTDVANGSGDKKTKTTYYMKMVDTGKHGFRANWLRETEIKRANISTSAGGATVAVPGNDAVVYGSGASAIKTTNTPIQCKLS